MLRFKILASAVPLLFAAALARGDFLPGARPCIAVGEGTVQIASLPWQAQLHVSFTRDPALATVRVQITDNAEAADFAVLDDADGAKADGCAVNAATRFVAISTGAAASGPVIYLSPDGPADYRIYVSSKRFSARHAPNIISAEPNLSINRADGSKSATCSHVSTSGASRPINVPVPILGFAPGGLTSIVTYGRVASFIWSVTALQKAAHRAFLSSSVIARLVRLSWSSTHHRAAPHSLLLEGSLPVVDA